MHKKKKTKLKANNKLLYMCDKGHFNELVDIRL